MVIVVSSPIQNVGKTSLAMLLTYTFAPEKKLLAIDADLGRNTFTERLGLKEQLTPDNAGAIFNIESLGTSFDFGFADKFNTPSIEGYEFVIIDFDVSRSAIHGDLYFPMANLIIVPRPPWTIKKVKDWFARFCKIKKDSIQAPVISYPVAFKYDEPSFEELKWTWPELYEQWKNYNIKGKINTGNGIPYNEQWEKFITFQDYNEDKLKAYIAECSARLKEDYQQWLQIKQ